MAETTEGGSGDGDRYEVRDDEVAIEAERLGHLAAARDPKTFDLLRRIGIGRGWHCLEAGAGTGSVARWMAEQVGDEGRVTSLDIDLRFHVEATANMDVRRHDLAADPLPEAAFDLVHTRAVLQHLPEREEVLDRLVAATRPGGSIVVEDGDFRAFAAQSVPDAYRPLHDIVCSATTTSWRDADISVRLLDGLARRGVTDLDVVGDVWAMRPGEPGGEWWFLALERAAPRIVEAGILTREQADAAIAAVRAPGFVMMSTLSIAVTGRRPE